MALASSLASSALQGNTQPQQSYPAQQQSNGGGVLGSILGALGIYLYNLNFSKTHIRICILRFSNFYINICDSE